MLPPVEMTAWVTALSELTLLHKASGLPFLAPWWLTFTTSTRRSIP